MKKFISQRRGWIAFIGLGLGLALIPPGAIRAEQASPVRGVPVYGTLLGHDGRPMLKGVVEVLRSEARPVEKGARVGPDGAFRIVVPELGLQLLRVSGVNHRSAILPLILRADDSVRVDVRLSPYQYRQTFDQVSAIGDFNRFSFQNPLVLEKQADGTYSAHIKAVRDSVAYELLGVEAGGRGIPGTDAAFYGYDGQGDFMAVVPAPDSMAVLTFDPKKLERSNDPLRVQFDPAHAEMDRYRAFYERGRELFTLFQQHYMYQQQVEAAQIDKRPEAVPRFQKGADSLAAEIKKADPDGLLDQAKKSKDPLERELLILQRFRLAGFDTDNPEEKLMRQVEKEVSPLSPWWSVDPDVIIQDLLTEGRRGFSKEYLQRVLDQHPDQAVRAGALICFIYRADRAKNHEEALAYFDRLTKEFGQTQAAAYAQALLNPNLKIREGEQVPDFSFVSLDKPGARYTKADFTGKIYLLDFWATWCGPCVAEMPQLHTMYEMYKDKGLEILSLSLDQQPDRVTTFRAGQWKMPWKNGFMEGGMDNPMTKAFEISSVPKAVLVDRTGSILATGVKLRGWQLHKTLERVFRTH